MNADLLNETDFVLLLFSSLFFLQKCSHQEMLSFLFGKSMKAVLNFQILAKQSSFWCRGGQPKRRRHSAVNEETFFKKKLCFSNFLPLLFSILKLRIFKNNRVCPRSKKKEKEPLPLLFVNSFR